MHNLVIDKKISAQSRNDRNLAQSGSSNVAKVSNTVQDATADDHSTAKRVISLFTPERRDETKSAAEESVSKVNAEGNKFKSETNAEGSATSNNDSSPRSSNSESNSYGRVKTDSSEVVREKEAMVQVEPHKTMHEANKAKSISKTNLHEASRSEAIANAAPVSPQVDKGVIATSLDVFTNNTKSKAFTNDDDTYKPVRVMKTRVKSKQKLAPDHVRSRSSSPGLSDSLESLSMDRMNPMPSPIVTPKHSPSKCNINNNGNRRNSKDVLENGAIARESTTSKGLDDKSGSKAASLQQLSVSDSKTEASSDECSEMLKSSIGTLSKDNSDWYTTLGSIFKMVRNPTSAQQERIVNHLLIEMKFVNKLKTYLELNKAQTLTELMNTAQEPDTVWSTLKRFLTIIWVVTDRDVNFCQHVLGSNLFSFMVVQLSELSTLYTQSDWSLFVIKANIGILHNIARQVPNSKWAFRHEGLVATLQIYIRSKIPMVKLKALIVLSYILSEAENEMINSDDDNFVFIFNVLSDALTSANHRSAKYGMSVLEVLTGVDNLAINDENKIRIVRNGALGLYQDILEHGSPRETKQAIVTLWSLAFHHYNKQKMRAMPGIMKRLDELQQSPDEGICHAARGTFWELENTSKTVIGSRSASSASSSTESDAGQPHIMISYQWDCQPIMLKVKDKLKHAGYKVWMDVEHMTGSTLEAMALAVEKAAVVLVCMSQKYKDSPNCRTEAEYVYRLRKDFVPLRLQQEYVPDGWLGILVGTRLYFDVHAEDMLESQVPRLIKELRDRGRLSPTKDAPDTTVSNLVPRRLFSRESVPILHSTGTEVVNWDAAEFLDWLTMAGVPEIHDRLAEVDGPLLLEMQKIQRLAPEYFYSMLRTDLGLNTVQILKFSKALRSLR